MSNCVSGRNVASVMREVESLLKKRGIGRELHVKLHAERRFVFQSARIRDGWSMDFEFECESRFGWARAFEGRMYVLVCQTQLHRIERIHGYTAV